MSIGVCKQFNFSGVCPRGDKCGFLHVIRERREYLSFGKPDVKLYLCSWFLSGNCRYGIKCNKVHSHDDVRSGRSQDASAQRFEEKLNHISKVVIRLKQTIDNLHGICASQKQEIVRLISSQVNQRCLIDMTTISTNKMKIWKPIKK